MFGAGRRKQEKRRARKDVNTVDFDEMLEEFTSYSPDEDSMAGLQPARQSGGNHRDAFDEFFEEDPAHDGRTAAPHGRDALDDFMDDDYWDDDLPPPPRPAMEKHGGRVVVNFDDI